MATQKKVRDLKLFYKKLEQYHQDYFWDMRFGQFYSNFFEWLNVEKRYDPFFPDDDRMLELIDEYCSIMFLHETRDDVERKKNEKKE